MTRAAATGIWRNSIGERRCSERRAEKKADAATDNEADRPRWFRRHPRAALLLFTLVLLLGLLMGADALLGLKDPNQSPDKVPISARSIRLKEHRPLMDITARPSDEYMKTVDGLGRMIFSLNWHHEDFADRYGKKDMPELEDTLLNNFEGMGDLVLYLKEKTIDPLQSSEGQPELQHA